MSQWETITVEIHNAGKVVERSFAAKFRPLNHGCEVTLDEAGVKLADSIAALRINTAAKRGCQLKYGFKQDGHIVGAYSEIAVVAVTSLPEWMAVQPSFDTKMPDVGNTLQVRGTTNRESWIPIYPDDVDDVPYIGVTANPPSPIVVVHGWILGSEAKTHELLNLGQGRDSFYPTYPHQHHDLCDLPEDAMAWLRSLPRGYADAIKDQERDQRDGRLQF